MRMAVFLFWALLFLSSTIFFSLDVRKSTLTGGSALFRGFFLFSSAQTSMSSSSSRCTYSLAFLPSSRVEYITECPFFPPSDGSLDEHFSAGFVDELMNHLVVLSLEKKNQLPFSLDANIPARFLPTVLQKKSSSFTNGGYFFSHFRHSQKFICLRDLLLHTSGINEAELFKTWGFTSSPTVFRGTPIHEHLCGDANDDRDVSDDNDDGKIRMGCGNRSMTFIDEVPPTLATFLDTLFETEWENIWLESKDYTTKVKSASFSTISSVKTNVKKTKLSNDFVHHSVHIDFSFSYSRTNIALVRYILDQVVHEWDDEDASLLSSNTTSSGTVSGEGNILHYLQGEVLPLLNLTNPFFLNCTQEVLPPLSPCTFGIVTSMKKSKECSSDQYRYPSLIKSNTSPPPTMFSILTPHPSVCLLHTNNEDLHFVTREVLGHSGMLSSMRCGDYEVFTASPPLPSFEEQKWTPSRPSSSASFLFSPGEAKGETGAGVLHAPPSSPGMLNSDVYLLHHYKNESTRSIVSSPNTEKDVNLVLFQCTESSTNVTTMLASSTQNIESFKPSQVLWPIIGVIAVMIGSAFVSYVVDHIVHPTPPTQPLLPEPDRDFGNPPAFSTGVSDTFSSESSSPSVSLSYDSARSDERELNGMDDGLAYDGNMDSMSNRIPDSEGMQSYRRYPGRSNEEDHAFSFPSAREDPMSEPLPSFSPNTPHPRSATPPTSVNSGKPVYLNMYTT